MKARLTTTNPTCPGGHPLSVEVIAADGKTARTMWRCLTCGWTHEDAA